MRAECRLLLLLGEIAVLDEILGDDRAFGCRLPERRTAITRADLAVAEHRVGGSKPNFAATASRSFMHAA
jgi:hypothetical protein